MTRKTRVLIGLTAAGASLFVAGLVYFALTVGAPTPDASEQVLLQEKFHENVTDLLMGTGALMALAGLFLLGLVATIEIFKRQRSKSIAQAACAALPGCSPIFGTAVAASEPNRYVIRVFCGSRPDQGDRLPPWERCRCFAVSKKDQSVEELFDPKYQPVLR